jgi:putative ABC transport system permease protein
MLATPEVRERSLRAFDRAFLLTYALEGIAVVIGLLAVAFAASSTVIARRAEFGMLRHVGLRRRDVRAMLAGEGIVSSTIAVLYGLLTGGALSLVLVYVINRQSFSWSIDLAIPWGLLAALSLVLVAAAAATSIASGRAATGAAAVRAVREDW